MPRRLRRWKVSWRITEKGVNLVVLEVGFGKNFVFAGCIEYIDWGGFCWNNSCNKHLRGGSIESQ